MSTAVAIIVAKKPRVEGVKYYSRKIFDRISQRLKRGFETRSAPSLRRKRNANIPTKLGTWTWRIFQYFRTRSVNNAATVR